MNYKVSVVTPFHNVDMDMFAEDRIHLTPAGTEAVAEQTAAILRAVLTGEAGA